MLIPCSKRIHDLHVNQDARYLKTPPYITDKGTRKKKCGKFPIRDIMKQKRKFIVSRSECSHSSLLGTHWECQHWVWCCDPLMERKNISHGNCDAIDKKSWKAARRLFVKNFACEVWQSQRRLGYTSARLAPRVSVSIAARDWCQWRWCLNVVWAVISWHSSHSNCSFEIQNTLHNITTDTSLIKWTPEKIRE